MTGVGRLARRITGLLAAVALATGACAAWPERPIRLIVPFGPGSGTDWTGRSLAEEIGPLLGTTVIVENKGGAEGRIGTEFVARAAPDGYTLMIASSATHSAIAGMVKTLPYQPVKDFAHISLLVTDPMLLVVHPSAGATLPEFIANARAATLPFGYGSATSLVIASTFNRMVGISALAVPYKSQPQSALDVAGGQARYMFGDATAVGPLVRGKRVLALGTTGEKRSVQFPDLPTFGELGHRGFDLQVWVGLAAPAGTPGEIVARINAAVQRALTRPEVIEKFRNAGKTVAPNSVAEQQALAERQLEIWVRRAAEAGLKPE
jgi:tripartite-type tricarboxylate transporter receptor subunit TctC